MNKTMIPSMTIVWQMDGRNNPGITEDSYSISKHFKNRYIKLPTCNYDNPGLKYYHQDSSYECISK